jgi:tetratricopeptide (TPR) repeat protein
MGFRMRRSVQLLPGVRLNLSKSGIGYSVGVKGFRMSHGADGKVRRTVSLPGTGMSHVTVVGDTDGGSDADAPAGRASDAPPAAPPDGPVVSRPGLLAPKAHKALAEALTAGDPAKVDAVGYANERVALAAAMFAGYLYLDRGDLDRAGDLLAWAFQTGKDPARDEFVAQYVHGTLTLEVVEGVEVLLPVGRSSLGLGLAEVRQAQGRAAEAVPVVEQLEPNVATAVSLCELNVVAGRFDEVVKLTEDITNSDDLTALLCTFRGVAFREQGYYDASRASFREALRFRSRHPVVRHRALLERARCYERERKFALARKDLERILADDSDYPGLADALAELA